LVSARGEWKQVAFMNENRALDAWYSETIERVRMDPSLFIFSGTCPQDHSALRITTRVPVSESYGAFGAGRIRHDQIEINENAPVSAVFDPRTEIYAFELPYLFVVDRENGIYDLQPPRLSGRYQYDRMFTERWECKAVRAEDVTYQFIICRASVLPIDPAMRNQRNQTRSFGSSGFYILSDGREASSTVKLSFGDDATVSENSGQSAANGAAPRPTAVQSRPPEFGRPISPTPATDRGWILPSFWSRLIDLEGQEFRLRFSPQTWTGKIASPRVLLAQKLTDVDALKSSNSADVCIWTSGSPSAAERLLVPNPEANAQFSIKPFPRDPQTAASILFDIKTFNGLTLGALQCYFPRAESPSGISFERLIDTIGAHVTLEIQQ
jgi:hypothetical protein